MDDLSKIKTDVALVQQQIAGFDKLFTKLDTTIDKISNLMETTNRMLVLHEERISNQIKENTVIHDLIETNKKENEHCIEEMKKEFGEKFTTFNTRIQKLELVRYGAMLLIVILGTFAGPFLTAYFEHFMAVIK